VTAAAEWVRRENRELTAQILSWSDQYNYIQESTSVVIEKSARKNLEFKNNQSKLLGKNLRLEEENRLLKGELAKVSGEAQALNQTVAMLRSEHLILTRLNDDLENRLTLAKNNNRDRNDSGIRSITDSQLEKSLNFDLELKSLGSLQNIRLDAELRPKAQRLSHGDKTRRRSRQSNHDELDSKYCTTTKCSIF